MKRRWPWAPWAPWAAWAAIALLPTGLTGTMPAQGPEVEAAGSLTLHGAGHATLVVLQEVVLEDVTSHPTGAGPVAVVITGGNPTFVHFHDPVEGTEHPRYSHARIPPGRHNLYVVGDVAAPTKVRFQAPGEDSVTLGPWPGTASSMRGLPLPLHNAQVRDAPLSAAAGDAVILVERRTTLTVGASAEASTHAITGAGNADCRPAGAGATVGVWTTGDGGRDSIFVPPFPVSRASVTYASAGGILVHEHHGGVIHFPLAKGDVLHGHQTGFWTSLWNDTPLGALPPGQREALRNAVCTAAAGPGL